ncbi:MAG: NADH:flavin oxidoreductase, partial [Pseudomonadota bacterium]
QQIEKLDNVEIFRESELNVDQILETGADHVAIATGATWCRDGFGANALGGIDGLNSEASIYTPDDIMAGKIPDVPTIIYDDDHYYMGTVIAEKIRASGVPVTLVTPEDTVSTWGGYTYDRWRAQSRLMEMGVTLKVSKGLQGFDGTKASTYCTYTGQNCEIAAEALVLVTARKPNDGLYLELKDKLNGKSSSSVKSIKQIGDCDAPAIIAAAVYSGHRYARELDEETDRDNPLKYDRVFFDDAATI